MNKQFIISIVADLHRRRDSGVKILDSVELLEFYHNWLIDKIVMNLKKHRSGYDTFTIKGKTFSTDSFFELFKLEPGIMEN